MAGTILIADDDASVREIVSEILIDAGYETVIVRDGNEALLRTQKQKFDLLVLDVHMPVRNGLEVLRELKKQGSSVPVIMMSGSPTISTLKEAITFGSVTLFEKPVRPETFLRTVETAIARRAIPRKNRRILIADDHGATRELLTAIVQEAGYDVVAVVNGSEAVTAAKNSSPHFDMALIDINMPVMRGDLAIEEIGRVSPETLLILLTGEASRDEIQSGYHKGAYTLIRKPFDAHILIHALAAYERESDERREEVRKQEEFRCLPFYRRWYVHARKTLQAPAATKTGMAVRMTVIVLLAMLIGVGLLKVATSVEQWANDGQTKIFSFFERMEGYMERDEDREIRGVDQTRRN